MTSSISAHRGPLFHMIADPAEVGEEASYQYWEDGLLVVADGKITAAGAYSDLLPTLPEGAVIENHPDSLIVPGFIDTHIHYPQTEMIGAFGKQLLEWLNTYTFPTERDFQDPQHARRVARVFLDELLKNGTTTALVFGTVHPESVDMFFEEALERNLRMICGKVMMDRNAPDYLCDTAESSYQDSKALLEKWHGKGRLLYAVTPRFAPTSTPEQLAAAGRLREEYPDAYMHTHLSENPAECGWVKELFPQCANYLDVYDHYGLLGKRAVLAHGVHLCEDEWKRLHSSDSAVAFCPTSNLFLGSGLFALEEAERHKVKVGLGTDVGGGTSFSLLQTLNEAYKVMQLRGHALTPFKSFYLATLGGAKALELDHLLGGFSAGKEADFVVLDKRATPLLQLRMENCRSLAEQLFAFSILGDDRAIRATYAAGRCVHKKD
ncbi:guanine deaminase [Hahella sp. HN01]|uniref:guanine deaminase n=1 Tax=Hahella sp. HN01 TaxID=2847262 RepID=UPI001C1EBC7D|nr:guanine deaminase [Hahella sp. HN01]MBU6953144.1 guanine deaminase [Hahella sp. HN01]